MKTNNIANIAGHQVESYAVRRILDEAIPSVKRVIEEMAIAGRGEDTIKVAAKITASTVVSTMAWMLTSSCMTDSETAQGQED